MKKLFLLIAVTFLVSCATTTTGSVGIVHNRSVPVEQSAWISPSDPPNVLGEITGYNGTAVKWKISRTKLFGLDIKFIQIPAGNTILEWNINTTLVLYDDSVYSTGQTLRSIKGKNILFAYNFRPGKKYFFRFLLKDEKYGFNVFSYNFDEEISFSGEGTRAHLEGFVPFLNVGGPSDRTILE